MTVPDEAKQWPEARGYSPRDCQFVDSLWNEARTARLSELYYGQHIKALMRWNFTIELLVAIAASGSGIAGWAVWQDKIGATLWACIAGAAAIIAVAKPLLALDRRIRNAARQQQLYRSLLNTLESLAFDIQQEGALTIEQRLRHQRARETLRQAETNDDPAPDRKILEALQARVNQEMPADSLWVPIPGPEPHPA